MAENLPFEHLGPYRLIRTIGKGGMGSVYLGQHVKSGDQVAVKLIAEHVADEIRFRRRFEAEVQSLKRLRHPGIVRLIGHGEEQGRLFYAMDMARGESLQALIRQNKRIDWASTIDIAIATCGALKHAHDLGIIHRDLKPANLIVDEFQNVKLVDFGIAKIFGESSEHTAAGSVLGTADFMAPEQATGSGITQRTDLYALGSMMYAMLSGRPPFRGKSVTAVIQSLQNERPVPLDAINPELPDAIVHLVHDLLQKNPADRPPTALAVMNRLKAMKVGLERGQTMVLGDDPTGEVGDDSEATEGGFVESQKESMDADARRQADAGESDSRRSADSELGSGGSFSSSSDSDRVTDGYEVTPQRHPSQRHTPVRMGQSVRSPLDASDQGTIQSDGGELTQGSADLNNQQDRLDTDSKNASDDAGGKQRYSGGGGETHYQTAGASSGRIFSGGDQAEGFWQQTMTVVAITIVSAIILLLGYIALQKPDADDLYAKAQDGDRAAIESFIRRYPDDTRSDGLNRQLLAQKLRAVEKRLRVQSQLKITPLSPAEGSFLTAIEDRQSNPTATRRRLAGWLAIFGRDIHRGEMGVADDPSAEDPDIAELGPLVRFELERLESDKTLTRLDPRAIELMAKINDSIQIDDTEKARLTLQGIVDTFADKDWAAPAVREAQMQLDVLDEFAHASEND